VGQDRENLAPLWPNSHRAQSHNKASSGQPIKKLPWKYIDKTPLRDILSSSTTLGSIESCFMGKKEQKSGTAFNHSAFLEADKNVQVGANLDVFVI
jgi:hypothetical protein